MRGIEICGYNPKLTSDPKVIKNASKVILPGVGAFENGMKGLRSKELIRPIKEFILSGKYFLGICLGMQLMSKIGNEGGVFKGLNLISGEVNKIPIKKNLKLPHVGWNNIKIIKNNPLFENIANNSCFYFVHSYSYSCNKYNISSITKYGSNIVSSINKKKIFGVQFHPERSQKNGEILLSNFIKFCKNHA